MKLILVFVVSVLLCQSAVSQTAGPTDALLNWQPVSIYTDGSTITEPVYYRIETLAPGATSWVKVTSVGTTSYLATSLPAGVHSWRILTLVGTLVSAPSDVATKSVAMKPERTSSLTVQ